MTSWDELEAYLSTLVDRVGGALYVLQDSGGRHLAPRLPVKHDSTLYRAAVNRWERARGGADPDKPDVDGTDNRDPAPEISRYLRYFDSLERSKQCSPVLDAAVGADFVKRGPGKRYVHRQADLPFIAERFLSSYLLIIAFGAPAAVDQGGAVLALERARGVICAILEGLPPDGGGARALSSANRLA